MRLKNYIIIVHEGGEFSIFKAGTMILVPEIGVSVNEEKNEKVGVYKEVFITTPFCGDATTVFTNNDYPLRIEMEDEDMEASNVTTSEGLAGLSSEESCDDCCNDDCDCEED